MIGLSFYEFEFKLTTNETEVTDSLKILEVILDRKLTSYIKDQLQLFKACAKASALQRLHRFIPHDIMIHFPRDVMIHFYACKRHTILAHLDKYMYGLHLQIQPPLYITTWLRFKFMSISTTISVVCCQLEGVLLVNLPLKPGKQDTSHHPCSTYTGHIKYKC